MDAIKKIQAVTASALLMLFRLVDAANPSITTVSVSIPALVQISGLSDIALAPTGFASPVIGASTACIYTNIINPLGSYYVTASSASGSAGTFRVTNGTHFINYNAFWNPSALATPTVSLTSGVKSTQQSGGNGSSLTCGGIPNANFNIRFTNTQVAGASAGTYSDTVTLLITPS